MLDLDELRTRASLLGDLDPTVVSGSWMRQALRELTEAREFRSSALDFKPVGDVSIGVDLSGPSGSFTALVASRGGKVEEIARL